MERAVAQRARRLDRTIDQSRAHAAALPAIKHGKLVDPEAIRLDLHQDEARDAAPRRCRDPQEPATMAELQSRDAMGRHGDNETKANAAISFVGGVFDLRQQLDFSRSRAANHGAGLVTLAAPREEEP
jgi:hypothetical protein